MPIGRQAALIYDARGRVVSSASLRGAELPYQGQSTTGRRSAYWQRSSESINSLLSGSLSTLRSRARDVFRKSPWASTAAECFTDSAIGTGIRPFPIVSDSGLRRDIMNLFEHWSTNEADADGLATFYGLQEMATREIREVGEVFSRFRDRRASDGLLVPLQLQLIEAEQCDDSYSQVLSTQREVKLGVEFDRLGRRRAYWMFARHPGDVNYSWGNALGGAERRQIPADQILHAFDVMRAGQVRGYPPIVVLLAKYKDVTETDDAYVVKQKISSLFAGFITKPTDESNPLGTIGEDDEGAPLTSLEPGILQELLPGEEVTFAQPPSGGADFTTWFRDQLRTLSSGSRVMYEMVTGDLTGVNYSSIRTGIIWHRRAIDRWRANVIIQRFCHPVWRRWYTAAVLAGQLPLASADSPDGIPRVRWIPTPGWAQIDPDKETRSTEREIRMGTVNRSQRLIEQAVDPEEFDEERQRENARADGMKLIYDSDPRLTTQSGQLQGAAAPKPAPKPPPPGGNAK